MAPEIIEYRGIECTVQPLADGGVRLTPLDAERHWLGVRLSAGAFAKLVAGEDVDDAP